MNESDQSDIKKIQVAVANAEDPPLFVALLFKDHLSEAAFKRVSDQLLTLKRQIHEHRGAVVPFVVIDSKCDLVIVKESDLKP